MRTAVFVGLPVARPDLSFNPDLLDEFPADELAEMTALRARIHERAGLSEAPPSPQLKSGPTGPTARIYTFGVVIRLMILRRRLTKFTWYGVHCRGGPRSISLGAAAYCQARQKVPTLVARQVLEQLMERLYGWLPANPVLPGRSVLVLEGSTVTLPHSVELAKISPAHCHQQAAASPWPLLRLVVLEAVQTGLAIRPHGGPETVSEQALGLQRLLVCRRTPC